MAGPASVAQALRSDAHPVSGYAREVRAAFRRFPPPRSGDAPHLARSVGSWNARCREAARKRRIAAREER
jgi:hypothetical protein